MISYESNPITPGAAVAARCKRVLFATVLVAMTAGLGEISPATAQLDSTFVDLSVTLDLGFVAGFPSAGSQGLRVRLLSQEGSGPAFTTLVPDRKIMDVWPQYPIGHGSTWAEGPFVVRVAREAPAETLRAELAQSFGVAACLLPEENPQLLGEAAEAYFPPEVGSSAESGFCWYQTFLHFSDPEEGPSPTLADANCDECAWFNDGLNASSRVLWQVNGEPGAFDDEYMADSVPVDMDLPQAWAITRGDADIVVAVLDPKGVGWQHPDLSGYQTATGDESLAEAVSQVQSAGGNVYVNPNDPPGLAPGSDPIRPGQAHVDDDLDGLTDEDWFGVQPDSSGALTPEIQMDVLVVSSLTATDTFSIQVAEADWADNQYANWELYMYFTDEIAWGSPSLVARIVGNTSNTLITDPPFGLSIFVYESPSYTNVGWLDWLSDLVNLGYRFVLVDVPSMNGEDDDGDSVPDDIRPYLSFMGADDDESGIVDDVVGYDFNFGASGEVPWGPGATELVDTRAATVNSNSSPNHGTVIAGIIAARHDADGWGAAGVVPNARIMPLLAYSVPAIAAAIKYALSFRNPDGSPVVDVITSSIGSSNAGYGAPLAAYTGLLQALQSAED